MKLTTILIFAIVLLLSVISANGGRRKGTITRRPVSRPQPPRQTQPQPPRQTQPQPPPQTQPKKPNNRRTTTPSTTTTTTTIAPIKECENQFKQIRSGMATNEELSFVSEMLYSMDDSNANNFVTINYQTKYSPFGSKPNLPLLQINEELYVHPTISKLRTVYNENPKQDSVSAFLDEVVKTRVIRCAMLYLYKKGHFTPNYPEIYKFELRKIWFTEVGRNAPTAFEHVFFGSKKDANTVEGLHNWIIFNELEKQREVTYNGWKSKIEIEDKVVVLKYNFDWDNINKPANSMFIGTSPELEMALYTICFFTRADSDCPLVLNRKSVNVKTVSFKHGSGKDVLVTAFPLI